MQISQASPLIPKNMEAYKVNGIYIHYVYTLVYIH